MEGRFEGVMSFQVLLVDDTRSVHAFVKSLLSKAPEVEVTSVYNGKEAVEILKSGKRFDAMFLDWEMPILNGPDAFQEMKKIGCTPPTVMMTTKNSPDDIRRMLEQGVSEYMMKPFTIDILFEKLSFVSGKNFEYGK